MQILVDKNKITISTRSEINWSELFINKQAWYQYHGFKFFIAIVVFAILIKSIIPVLLLYYILFIAGFFIIGFIGSRLHYNYIFDVDSKELHKEHYRFSTTPHKSEIIAQNLDLSKLKFNPFVTKGQTSYVLIYDRITLVTVHLKEKLELENYLSSIG